MTTTDRRSRCVLAWSSGKDSAWALHTLRQQHDVEVVGLLTTINEAFDRVAMHGVRHELLRRQAGAAGLRLWVTPLPWPCSDEEYERRMAETIERLRSDGVEQMAFGDLFLDDIRAYRERQLQGTGIAPRFPLWGRDTAVLAREMVDAGVRARVTCVDPRKLDPSFCGREYDHALLDELPPGVDPCAENGEFHSFCHAGPMFDGPIAVEAGEVVLRDGFWFADLMPG